MNREFKEKFTESFLSKITSAALSTEFKDIMLQAELEDIDSQDRSACMSPYVKELNLLLSYIKMREKMTQSLKVDKATQKSA